MSLKCNVLKSGFCELTQGFGGSNNHRGLDLVDKGYTIGDVVSYDNGTVVMVTNGYGNGQGEGANWAYGNFVKVLHDNGTVCLYAHMEYTSVAYGQRVSKGQFLGRMGNSGNSGGGHLHWEYWARNDYNANIDPMPYLEPKPLFTIEKVPTKKVKYKKDVSLWDLSFTSFSNVVAVNHYKKDEDLEVGAIATHVVGSKYYISKYDYEHKINNGVNVDDCYDYIEPVVVETPVVEEPIIAERNTPTENDDIKPIEEPKQEDNTNNTEIVKEPINGFKSIIKYIIEKILEYLKERYNNDKKNFKSN